MTRNMAETLISMSTAAEVKMSANIVEQDIIEYAKPSSRLLPAVFGWKERE
jgi:hypothetical protein